MRLDLFLKSSRLVVRRTLAQEFCDAGLVKVNGVTAKSSREVKSGDEIEIKRYNRLLTIRVRQIPAVKQIARAAAADLYEIIGEAITPDEMLFKSEDSNDN